jgi:hypothetical protein
MLQRLPKAVAFGNQRLEFLVVLFNQHGSVL